MDYISNQTLLEILEALASSDDPITVHTYCPKCGTVTGSEATTPSRFLNSCPLGEGKEAKIRFYGAEGEKDGTFFTMILDRLGYGEKLNH